MILRPSIIAAQPANAAYHADAVHFDGAAFLNAATLVAANGKGATTSLWFKAPVVAAPLFPIMWVVDSAGDYQSFSGYEDPSGIYVNYTGTVISEVVETAESIFTGDLWYNLLASCDTSGSPKIACYLNDVAVGQPPNTEAGSNYNISFNGLSFRIGGDTFGSDDSYIGDMADFILWPGVSICEADNTITEENRRLFIAGNGKPVNPIVAIAALGTPAIRCSGDAASFGTNQGTGGVFTTTGTLTNASTSPSD